jgi:uncharacterized protein YrrD
MHGRYFFVKKSVDILGLPIISITEGKELGKVKSLVINPTAGSVAALAIDDGKWYLGAKLLPFAAITGLGEYAVTIENSSSVCPYHENPEFENLLTAEIGIIGTKVLTKSGRILGKVDEIVVDLSGKITACEIEDTNGDIMHLTAQRVLTFGKEVLIVGEADEPAVPAAATVTAPKITPEPIVPSTVENIAVPKSTVPEQIAAPVSAPEAVDESGKKFDDKHRKFLLGKKSNRRIETDNGMIIVEQGGEITEEVIQKAKLAGKFVELSMSIS